MIFLSIKFYCLILMKKVLKDDYSSFFYDFAEYYLSIIVSFD